MAVSEDKGFICCSKAMHKWKTQSQLTKACHIQEIERKEKVTELDKKWDNRMLKAQTAEELYLLTILSA